MPVKYRHVEFAMNFTGNILPGEIIAWLHDIPGLPGCGAGQPRLASSAPLGLIQRLSEMAADTF